jgi:ADP-heptose:LPS heptosyltransferase
LPELISILAGARAVVSPDSGPAHLAAALDRPTLVLFGPTDPERTKPIGRQVTVLNHAIHCSPCLKRRCPQDEPVACMAGIGAGAVRSYLTRL